MPEVPGGRGGARGVAAYAPALLWAGLLLYLGGRTGLTAPPTTLPLDKLAHFALYGVLGALAALGWVRSGGGAPRAVVVALALLVGAADELHQRRVPGRSSEVADWVADALGIGVGFALVAGRPRGTQGRSTA